MKLFTYHRLLLPALWLAPIAAAAQVPRALMPIEFVNSAEFGWLKKPVLASRVLDDMTRPATWRMSGTASLTFPDTPRLGGMRVLRVDMQMFRDAPAPTRSRLSTVNLQRDFAGEDWSGFNRLSMWVRPEYSGVPALPLTIVLRSDGVEKLPDRYNREGTHHVTLAGDEWQRVVWEIDPLPRDRVTRIEFGYFVNRMLAGPTDRVAFEIGRLELQKVEPDHHTGWNVAPGRIAFSHTGDQSGLSKTAIASALQATEFELVRVDNAAFGNTVLRKPVRTVKSVKGEFQELDFSEVNAPGALRAARGIRDDAAVRDRPGRLEGDDLEGAQLLLRKPLRLRRPRRAPGGPSRRVRGARARHRVDERRLARRGGSVAGGDQHRRGRVLDVRAGGAARFARPVSGAGGAAARGGDVGAALAASSPAPLPGICRQPPRHSRETSPASPPEAKLVPIRVVRKVIVFRNGDVARGIHHAADRDCHVISMSLGGVGGNTLHDAVRYAVAKDVIVCAAAGNFAKMVVWPARYPESIAVAGTNSNSRPWKGSCRGEAVDIAAPAAQVWTAARPTSTDPRPAAQGEGTSFAVAAVAGIAALWLSHHGRNTLLNRYRSANVPLQYVFLHVLQKTARDIGLPANQFDAGFANAEGVLRCPLPDPGDVATQAQAHVGAVDSFDADAADVLGSVQPVVGSLAVSGMRSGQSAAERYLPIQEFAQICRDHPNAHAAYERGLMPASAGAGGISDNPAALLDSAGIAKYASTRLRSRLGHR